MIFTRRPNGVTRKNLIIIIITTRQIIKRVGDTLKAFLIDFFHILCKMRMNPDIRKFGRQAPGRLELLGRGR